MAAPGGTKDSVEGRFILHGSPLWFFYFQGKRSLSCRPPMVKLVCPADNPRAEGLECAKTCQNYDLQCMSTGCVSGCLCPPGMVSHHSHRGGQPGVSLQAGTYEVALGQREEKIGAKQEW